jgi:quercetin dioxygenase-like cupin family protein
MEVVTRNATMKGPDNWFTGDVFVDAATTNQGPSPWSLGSVHFRPCAHTAWHRHTLGQTLFVTEGEGFVQARNGALVRIRPGDVIRIAPDEEHSHGATATRFMTHLALTEGETIWGAHLTDDEYPSS